MTEAEKAQRKADRAAARARNDALAAEDQHRLREAQRALWTREGMWLTLEQINAGEPCRGCGLVVNDRRGDWGGTMYLSPEDKAEYDAADDAWRERHGDCHAGRWSLSGSRSTHCMHCCPPPPIPDGAAENLARILSVKTPDTQLDRWRCTLTCGHTIDGTVHEEHRKTHRASGVRQCPTCDEQRGVVAVEYLGPLITPENAETRRRETARKAELDAARGEVANRKKGLAEAERRVRDLRAGK
jgi:hypothetical protein